MRDVKSSGTFVANWVPLDVAATVEAAAKRSALANSTESVGLAGPWDSQISVSKLGRDLVKRGRRRDKETPTSV